MVHGQKEIQKSKDSGHAFDTSGSLEVDSRSTFSALGSMPAWLFGSAVHHDTERRRSRMNNISQLRSSIFRRRWPQNIDVLEVMAEGYREVARAN